MRVQETIKKIKKFLIDDVVDRLEYEAILNNPQITVLKEVVSFDKAGNFFVVVWYEESQE